MSDTKEFNFTEAMAELEKINQWFQEEDIDLEKALEQLRRGKALIEKCQDRLKEVENEFKEIKGSFPDVESTELTTLVNKTEEEDSDLPF